jgi:hypothetical protein
MKGGERKVQTQRERNAKIPGDQGENLLLFEPIFELKT